MKTIPLTKGQVAIVDDDMFEMLSIFSWHAYKPHPNSTFYAAGKITSGKTKGFDVVCDTTGTHVVQVKPRERYKNGTFKTENRSYKPKNIRMHRLVANCPKGRIVDHINGNSLDNRKENLRVCNKSQNGFNRGKNRNNVTGFKGVSFSKKNGKYLAQIHFQGKSFFGGYFDTADEAAKKYNKLALKYCGEFAYTNQI